MIENKLLEIAPALLSDPLMWTRVVMGGAGVFPGGGEVGTHSPWKCGHFSSSRPHTPKASGIEICSALVKSLRTVFPTRSGVQTLQNPQIYGLTCPNSRHVYPLEGEGLASLHVPVSWEDTVKLGVFLGWLEFQFSVHQKGFIFYLGQRQAQRCSTHPSATWLWLHHINWGRNF